MGQGRAQARKLLAVHKAAEGSLKHAKEAATAVAEASRCLDQHHGSSSGLMPESWRDVALRLMSDDDQSWTQVKSKGKGNDWSGKGGNWGGWENQSKGKGKGKGKGKKVTFDALAMAADGPHPLQSAEAYDMDVEVTDAEYEKYRKNWVAPPARGDNNGG